MSSNHRACFGPITRREALAGFAAAMATAALPGLSRAFAAEERMEAAECLWFPRENAADLYDAYAIELDSDGSLWLEYDDGYLHAFSPGEWSLAGAADGRWLWLWETDEAWYGYECLTDSDAQDQLEDLA